MLEKVIRTPKEQFQVAVPLSLIFYSCNRREIRITIEGT